MSGRNVSNNGRQAIYAAQTKDAFIVLITITHPSWTDDVRISSDPTQLLPIAGVRGTISNALEYLFGAFSINLPAQDDTGVAKGSIQVDNVSRELMKKIRQADSSVGISMQVVLSSAPDTAEVTINDFKLERVTYDAFVISGDISVEYFDLEPFPWQRFGPSKWQAIF